MTFKKKLLAIGFAIVLSMSVAACEVEDDPAVPDDPAAPDGNSGQIEMIA